MRWYANIGWCSPSWAVGLHGPSFFLQVLVFLAVLGAVVVLVAAVFGGISYRRSGKSLPESTAAMPPNPVPELVGFQPRLGEWSVADIVDLEYLLRSEREADGLAAWHRDRAIYRKIVADAPPSAMRERTHLVLSWLEARKFQGGPYFGGRDLVRSWKLLVTTAVGISFAVGVLHAGGVLLLLDQNNHVSATKAALATVGLQLLATLLGVVVWTSRKALWSVFGEFTSLRVAIVRAVLPRFSVGTGRRRFVRYLEDVSELEQSHRPLVLGHIAMAAQLCVIAMCLGLLVSLDIYHFSSQDVRFGWSATRNIESTELQQAVKVISTPWRIFTSAGQPTLSQIEESRLSRDTPMRTVSSAASRAWAEFLSLAILTYGVVLRLVLFLVAAGRASAAARKPMLEGPPIDNLLRRMSTDPPMEKVDVPPPGPGLPETKGRFRWRLPWKKSV